MAILEYGNPYTHYEFKRESFSTRELKELHNKNTCDWCGNTPKVLFSYNNDKHLFCNKSCYESYHETCNGRM